MSPQDSWSHSSATIQPPRATELVLGLWPGHNFVFGVQNHGFAVDEATLPANVRATHRSLFDGSLQGIEVQDKPAFSFQGHPEASPGPHDIAGLFSRFVLEMVTRIRRKIAVRDGVAPTGQAGAEDHTGAP